MLIVTNPQSQWISKLVAGLAVHRNNGVFWDSTRDSAMAVTALAEVCVSRKLIEQPSAAIERLCRDGEGRRSLEFVALLWRRDYLEMRADLFPGDLVPLDYVQETARIQWF